MGSDFRCCRISCLRLHKPTKSKGSIPRPTNETIGTKWRRGGKELAPLVRLLLVRGGTRIEGRHLGRRLRPPRSKPCHGGGRGDPRFAGTRAPAAEGEGRREGLELGVGFLVSLGCGRRVPLPHQRGRPSLRRARLPYPRAPPPPPPPLDCSKKRSFRFVGSDEGEPVGASGAPEFVRG